MNKLFIGLFFFTNIVFSQNIKGFVFNVDTPIQNASIVLKNNNRIIDFVFTNKDGAFNFEKITIKKITIKKITIEISYLNFKTQILELNLEKNIDLKIQLENNNKIEEVLIKKQLAISKKIDTLIYNTNSFKDGTEKVVEDLLKKLPGIDITKGGKVLYKGKEIEALMLDGDDLFNNQYTIGTKTIDVNLIESVEAIDNFNKNGVLHNITRTEDVALNLKLKKGKTSLNLNANFENNFYSKYNNSITAILLNSKNKGFNTTRLNNVGENINNTFNFSKDNYSKSKVFSKIKNQEILSQGSFPVFLGNSNSILNNSFNNYTSYLRSINKYTKTTSNVNVYIDKINQFYQDKTIYSFNNEKLSIVNSEEQIKNIQSFSFDNTTTYFNKSNFQIENKFLYEINNNSLLNLIDNNGILQNSNAETKNYFLGNKTELTTQINKNAALNFLIFYALNNSNQNYYINPGISFNNINYASNNQISNIKSNIFNFKVEYYKNWSRFNLKLENVFENKRDKLLTSLNNNLVSINEFENNVNLENINNNFKFNFNYKTKKIKIGVASNLTYYNTSFLNSKKSINDILFSINVKYYLTKKTSINVNLDQTLDLPNLVNLYPNNVLINFRNIRFNNANYDFIKTNTVGINYEYNDLFNTVYLNIGAKYFENNKDYYFQNEISRNLIVNKSVLLDFGNKNLSFNLVFHKFLPFISSTIKLNSNLSISSGFNFVNNLELREIENKIFTNNIILYSGFKTKINFENNIEIQTNYFKINQLNNNSLSQIKNDFKIIYKLTKSMNFNTVFQTFIPNIDQSKKYNFLNFELNYFYKNLNFSLKGQNLLNVKRFESENLSDFSSSVFSYNLQERFILLGLNYKIL